MNFTQDQLKQIQDGHGEIAEKYKKRMLDYLKYPYANCLAKESATHGFSRRLNLLVRCADNIFSILPPDQTVVPEKNKLNDTVINIQSFIFNIFGCTENLASIWVHEKNLEVRPGLVGLRKQNTRVRETFSNQFQDYLTRLDNWFDNLENFRHALAHRIPLYIPPYVVTENNNDSYQELERRMQEAFLRMDLDEHDRLSYEQEALRTFVPIMTHSFQEGARKVVFHAQIVADFNTIYELSGKFLEELSR
jgi:hypothetical protein